MSWMKVSLKRITLEMMLTNRDSRILSELDPKQIVKQVKKAGAEVVTVWFKDENGYAYYPTKCGTMHPNLKGRDFSGEMVERLKAFGIKVVAYYCVGLDWNYASTHPDEQIVFSDSKPGLFPIPCLNTQYREYVLEQLVEIVREYDIDGVWLDCIFYPPKDFFPDPDSEEPKKSGAISCYCMACQEKVRSETGLTIPRKLKRRSDSWVTWIRHRKDTLDSFVNEAHTLIKSINPNVNFSHNLMSFEQHDWRGSLSWRTEAYDDWLSAESYYAWSGHLQTSLLPRLLQTAGDGKPFEAITLSYARLWDWTVKPIPQLLAEAMITVALGGALVVDDHISPFGKAEPQMYQRIKEVFNRIDQVKPYCNNLESVKYAAVIYSEQTRDFFACGDPRKYQSSFDGTCRALIEEKIPFDVLMAERIAIERLREYNVIVLPNVACLDNEVVRTIDEAIDNGVGIVATYATSLYDGAARKRNDFALRSLGIHYQDNPSDYPHVFYQFDRDPKEFVENIQRDIPINMNKPYISTTGIGRGIGRIRHPMIWACNHHYRYYENPPGGYSKSPALWINEINGKGKATYFPCDVGGTYAEFTIPEAKHLLVNAVVWAGGEVPLRINAPLSVEAVYQWQKARNRIVIHLVNFPSAPLRTAKIGGTIDSVQVVEKIPEIHQMRVNLGTGIRQRIKAVTSLQHGDIGWRLGDSSVSVPALHIHDVIILDLMG